MEPLANWNGKILPLSEVRISPLDRSFLFGDAVYEVLRIYQSKPWLERDHFDRLARSLRELRIEGVDVERLRTRMHETIRAGGFREASIYIHVSRGEAPRRHAFPKNAVPLELMWVEELATDPYADKRQTGVGVITYPDLRWHRCDIKTVNLLGNVFAIQAAYEAGCSETLLYAPDGTLTESAHSSFFAVLAGELRTSPLPANILPGCTRQFVMQLAQSAGVRINETSLHRDDLPHIQELFLTGTTCEILPVIRVDQRSLGEPGPITRQLQALYANAVRRFVGG